MKLHKTISLIVALFFSASVQYPLLSEGGFRLDAASNIWDGTADTDWHVTSYTLDDVTVFHISKPEQLAEEVISHLTDLDGCSVDIHLEVSASNPDGFTVPIVRAVSENCRTLKVEEFGFDK